ncbi:MAG: hypothetical protein J6Q06_04355 [Clostridia bacterium]|nr:hypothetical protein [Clostridia bacterium]
MEPEIISAIVTGSATIIGAIIAAIVVPAKKRRDRENAKPIIQKQSGQNNIQIGIINAIAEEAGDKYEEE